MSAPPSDDGPKLYTKNDMSRAIERRLAHHKLGQIDALADMLLVQHERIADLVERVRQLEEHVRQIEGRAP